MSQFTIQIPYELSPQESLRRPLLAQVARNTSAYGPWHRFTYLSERADGAREVDMLSAVVVGQTGYGKSSLLNALTGAPAFESDAVRACTRTAQSASLMLSKGRVNRALSLLDLPGIGESDAEDAKTLTLYRGALANAGVVLFVLRADKRDHERDLFLWERVIRPTGLRVVWALNACDKVEPLSRRGGGLTPAQDVNVTRKVEAVSALFGCTPGSVVRVSATEGWGVEPLWCQLLAHLAA
ncbi:MAG: hypothetical protein FJ138_02310 [Deltaproteobacteria bacterium]|nr:hypothetical protein [Deltaproteobacteria bacterium]